MSRVPVNSIEKVIVNTLDDLAGVHELVAGFVASQGMSSKVEFELNVVLDEILSNIIKYGYEDDARHEIRLRLALEENMLTVEIEDDGRPFDPLAKAPPDLGLPLAERPIGGLGLHFVRNLTDEARYERIDDRNRLTLRKSLAP